MDVEGVETIQRVSETDPYPITPKDHGVDFLMDHRHLWLRSQRQHAIIRVRHEMIKAVRDYFDSHGFTLVDTPIFTPAACEGTTTLSKCNYFDDEKAYLTHPASSTTKPPPWRSARSTASARPSAPKNRRRAATSRSSGWWSRRWPTPTLEDVKRVAEEMVVFVVGRVLENRREELKVLERDVTKLEAVQAPFPRMSYDEAVKNLQAKGSEIQWGGDFGGTDETLLTQQFDRPMMVDRYPTAIKAFYMQPDPERPEVALGVDVLAPEGYGEIIGGGQRIHDLDLLLQAHRRAPTCRAKPSTGISICASTAPCRTAASAWASSAAWPGSAAWSMFARPSRFPACCTGCGRRYPEAVDVKSR